MAYLVNKVGIVTGGGTGIGKATALGMAKAGASLVIGNRNAKLGEEVVRAIEQAGGRAVFQVTDVSKPDDAKALVERAVKEFGRLDLAFNNAGMDGEQVPLHEQDIDSFRWAESVSPTKSPILAVRRGPIRHRAHAARRWWRVLLVTLARCRRIVGSRSAAAKNASVCRTDARNTLQVEDEAGEQTGRVQARQGSGDSTLVGGAVAWADIARPWAIHQQHANRISLAILPNHHRPLRFTSSGGMAKVHPIFAMSRGDAHELPRGLA
jgi:short chain dehydrogenase